MAKQTITIFMLLALLVVLGTGCSGKKTKAANLLPPPTVDPRDDDDDDNDNHTGGETVEFTFKSDSVLQQYTGRAVSREDLSDVTINFDFADVDETDVALYGGEVRIAYKQQVLDPNTGNVTGTKNKNARFWSSDSTLADNQVFDAQFNKFYTGTGGTAFKAFVQDSLGALIIVFSEETNDLGTWSGRVYFKNFNFDICSSHWPYFCNAQPIRTYGTLNSLMPVMDGSTVPCWFIKDGPYSCRDYLVNGKIDPKSSLYPTSYQLLGTFDNVDLTTALNIED